MTFSNSSGLTATSGGTYALSPILNESATGSGTVADPGVFQFSFEITEANHTTFNLPDLTSDKEITCYMSNEPFDYNVVSSGADIQSTSELHRVTVAIQPQSGSNNPNNPSAPTGDNTSGAMDSIGKKAIISLLSLLGLLAIY